MGYLCRNTNIVQQLTGELPDGTPVPFVKVGGIIHVSGGPYVTSVMGSNCSICWKSSSKAELVPFSSFFDNRESRWLAIGESGTSSLSCKRVERA